MPFSPLPRVIDHTTASAAMCHRQWLEHELSVALLRQDNSQTAQLATELRTFDDWLIGASPERQATGL
ncbi:MAG: hypothetical protein K0U93_18480 [Gammaproteobacteria bacterium]|nr:hypothetical protein [Gammaproteobacteria bacterium]